ncbi:hypothetical protein IRJ41_013319 [Triplophysa rosa]|uniref:Uncharacterized protein n=1 Tax=Triplophysa rosa TaxID=992332 RepID=A0A9W7WRD9_TRIRA|nr:hypothetical protein IRJ41_013319 [Triplophysa rosa]
MCANKITKLFFSNDACVGMRRGEEYDFDLPDAVAKNVQIDSCDVEWSVDQYMAILDGKEINFSLPFKNLTTYGISVKMNVCPVSVKYHVSCHVYTRSLTCSCMNDTKKSVSSTTLPSTDTPWSFGYKRNHY